MSRSIIVGLGDFGHKFSFKAAIGKTVGQSDGNKFWMS